MCQYGSSGRGTVSEYSHVETQTLAVNLERMGCERYDLLIGIQLEAGEERVWSARVDRNKTVEIIWRGMKVKFAIKFADLDFHKTNIRSTTIHSLADRKRVSW